jgi:hypothetical protein
MRTRRRPLGTFVIGCSFALALLAWVRSARAASPAEDAFQEGRRLLAEGQTDEACLRFAESYSMVASSGTLLNLAQCHQTQGKTATAWNEYRAAARLARNQGREDRAAVADEKAAALEPNLARVSITAVEAISGLRVATEAGPLGEGGLAVDVPIDPGTHKVTATAPGYLPWTATLQVKESQQLAIEIPKLEPEPVLPGLARLVEARSAADSRRSSVGIYLGVGGAVLLATGTAFWSVSYAKLQSAKDACALGCSKADRDGRVGDIQTLKGVAVGTWIAGGALVAASGAYFLLRKGKTTTTTVALDPTNAGFLIGGSF